jgi:hypothetical protein
LQIVDLRVKIYNLEFVIRNRSLTIAYSKRA